MKRIEHREESWLFPFVEYSPEIISGKLPLILQFHGAGERGDGGAHLNAVEVNGFAGTFARGEFPCILIMPQCPEDSFWAARVESVLRFIQQLTEAYDIDRSRIYLTGMSMGGFGTWYTAMAAPELFAAIAPVCGGGMAWNAGVLHMPVWAFHGAQDPVVSPRHSEEMVQALENCGGNVRYTKLENVGHNAWTHAYNEQLLSWLLSHKKG